MTASQLTEGLKAIVRSYPLWSAVIAFVVSLYVAMKITDYRLTRIEADVTVLMAERKADYRELSDGLHRLELQLAELTAALRDKR